MEEAIVRRFANSCAIFLPLVTAAALAYWGQHNGRIADDGATHGIWADDTGLLAVKGMSAKQLENYFDSHGYAWLPGSGKTVPPIAVTSFPGDLSAVRDAKRKKALFFRTLLPIVLAENNKIRRQRDTLLDFLAHMPAAGTPDRVWLQELMAWYRMEGDISDQGVQRQLLRRVDIIPPELVLAQAANESAWGTSRFAQLGNNLFGIWTYDESKGIVPEQRGKGLNHAVKVFPDVHASVRGYMRNLNTNRAYRELRQLRSTMRQTGNTLNAQMLAEGLINYSERGAEYVRDIQSLIRVNRLYQLQSVALRPADNAMESLLAPFTVGESTSG
jgi:Bax protein